MLITLDLGHLRAPGRKNMMCLKNSGPEQNQILISLQLAFVPSMSLDHGCPQTSLGTSEVLRVPV